jgi:hypothetical protein
MRQAVIWTLVGSVIAAIFVAAQRKRDHPAKPEVELSVGPTESPSPDDGDLQDGIENLLGNARATREEGIDVDVTDGVATLAGVVEDPAASRVAEALAESYPGIKEVRNKIELHHDKDAREEAAKQKDKDKAKLAGPGQIVIPMPNLPNFPPVIIGPQGPGGGPPAPGTPQAEALAELLKEGRKALAGGHADDALGIYTAALMIDNRNAEARQGMQQAARMVRRQFGRGEMPPPPAAPAAPAPSVAPVPRPSRG